MLGVRVVNGEGNDLSFGGRVIKNVAGFDLSRLMVAAMGTLGVILEASLKTVPRPAVEETLCFSMPEIQALRVMNEWAGKLFPITATCYEAGMLSVRLS